MFLSFLGAAREVTGSCYLVENAGKRILIDCGMEQGRDVYTNQPLPVAAGMIDAVLVTHAHIDHTGRLPLLVKQGFSGDIFCTEATADLMSIMLRDSAHIQETEAEWKTRKNLRAGRAPEEPLYTVRDADNTLRLLKPVRYGERAEIVSGAEARFTDVGHLLGSAAIELFLTEDGTSKTIVFSGDIGNLHQPILRDPEYIRSADRLIIESTYGNRSHGARPDYLSALTSVIQTTFDKGGNLVIPSFAVGRTQELLFFIRQIKEEGRVKGHPNFPVYVDSPLAVEATQIFKESDSDYFDDETCALLRAGKNPISFPNLITSVTADDSKAINNTDGSKVILSASGMCEAGRIRHHLKHNLWREESTVLFVGYQAEGTVGRALVSGEKEVKLFGETIEVKARIETLAGVSGHADREGLLKWANAFEKRPERVYVTHGDEDAALAFADRLENDEGYCATVPYNGEKWDIIKDECVIEGSREKRENAVSAEKTAAKGAYSRLVAAAERLLKAAKDSAGLANRLSAKFTDQINALCDKWENRQ
ncbi:MAG: MBL fold metallo-hydrolase [Eubacteriales bacterium]|nr:MBL fold metallo-hydrolase [Eubacteriales bacterium]MDD3881239.1 MBL fold metallo-hydrolase [Eubacteriales bacterium]MDD4512157.1 MBL fold metallo-hydrolase [Eubacteriales bacterium]